MAKQARVPYKGANLYPKQRAAIYDPARIVTIEASTKAGKGLLPSATIYTPTGPVSLSTLQVGSVVSTPDGRSARVIGIYPRGAQDTYRITFNDGRSVICDSAHLWEIESAKRTPRVVDTATLTTYSSEQLQRMWIPITQPVQFETRAVPLDPYLLGVLIGDGSLRGDQIRLSSADSYILGRCAAVVERTYDVVHRENHDYAFKLRKPYQHIPAVDRLPMLLRKLGLKGTGSHEKFVPPQYRYNSETVRWEVLRGIFDTDGHVDKHGQPVLEQTSEQLAADVREIIETLGGYCRISTKVGRYRGADGKPVDCRTVYRMCVTHPDAPSFFSLPRKRECCRPKKKFMRRTLRAVEPVGRQETTCIEVNTEHELFLTDHCVVTHNTAGCLAWLLEQAATRGADGRAFWWVAPVYSQAEIAYRRMKRYIPQEVYKSNQAKLTLTLVTGARIEFRSAERPDTLFGDDVYAAVLDEASRMQEAAWHAVRSTLTYTKGPVRMIGNIRGRKNWFFKLARAAEQGAEGMAYHRLTAWDAVQAGVLDGGEIEQARADFDRIGRPEIFRELYLAEPAQDGGNPFGLDAIANCVVPALSAAQPIAAGVDFAGRGAKNINTGGGERADRDWTAVVALDKDGVATLVDRWQLPHAETEWRLVKLLGRTPTLGDSTGQGDQMVERLQRRGDMRVEGYVFSPRSKQQLMERLALAIQSDPPEVYFPEGELIAELEGFEFAYSSTGVRYEASPGLHDDLVCALALAVMKLPWRRKHVGAPVGVSLPGGSRWTGNVADASAWQRYQESLKPTAPKREDSGDEPRKEETPKVSVPEVISGPGSGRWR